MTNIHLNLSQNINSFLRPIGLSLSNKKQIIAKITTIALVAIFLVGNLHSVMAGPLCGDDDGDDVCLARCLKGCDDSQTCSTECHNKCCKSQI